MTKRIHSLQDDMAQMELQLQQPRERRRSAAQSIESGADVRKVPFYMLEPRELQVSPFEENPDLVGNDWSWLHHIGHDWTIFDLNGLDWR